MQGYIVVESREAALRESDDLIGSGQMIAAELGELLAGKAAGTAKLPHSRPWTVFKSLGVGATDLAAARVVWEGWKALVTGNESLT
jgi:thiomorpholine-carboxylate dehydrogenase